MEQATNHYSELSKIDVSKHIEKKGKSSYLSWPWAVDMLMRQDPKANWEFHEPKMFGESMMVSCTVTAFGKPITMHLPVMNHSNKAISNPDAFDVNKNMMRCLVKAIACHGLGITVYAGEDLPVEPAKPDPLDEEAAIKRMERAQTLDELKDAFGSAYKKATPEQQVTLKTKYDVCKSVLTVPEAA